MGLVISDHAINECWHAAVTENSTSFTCRNYVIADLAIDDCRITVRNACYAAPGILGAVADGKTIHNSIRTLR